MPSAHLVVLLLPVVLVVVLGVIVLGVELSLLLLLLPLAWAGQVLGLLPWRLVLTATDGTAPCCGVADSCARLLLELPDRRRPA